MCGATASNKLPNTASVYSLMVSSQLPKKTLGNIWSLVNKTHPGTLTREEFYACLALIALAQVNPFAFLLLHTSHMCCLERRESVGFVWRHHSADTLPPNVHGEHGASIGSRIIGDRRAVRCGE